MTESETGLPAARDSFQHDRNAREALWRSIGVEPAASALTVSLFCYANKALPALLDAWTEGDEQIVCVVPEGVAQAELDRIAYSNIDRAFLTSFGRFWSDQAASPLLVEREDWRPALAAAEATLQQATIRPLLVSGEPLVGKTSFLRLLADRLAPKGWSVFEASGADLMAIDRENALRIIPDRKSTRLNSSHT